MFSKSRYQYSALNNNISSSQRTHRLCNFFLLLLLIAAPILSFYLGRTTSHCTLPSTEPSLSTHTRTFTYNPLYGSPPSPSTNTAWLHLFPSSAGFFRHPTLAPQRSAFSTFHQLHCLDGIRHGYWHLYEVAAAGKPLNESEVPMMGRPAHIRHCVDLLRQSLMCRPDLTVERKDESVGGVRGFGTSHVCGDWGELVEWTRRWEEWVPEGEEGEGRVGDGGLRGHSHGE